MFRSDIELPCIIYATTYRMGQSHIRPTSPSGYRVYEACKEWACNSDRLSVISTVVALITILKRCYIDDCVCVLFSYAGIIIMAECGLGQSRAR